ncbi:NAD(P)-dependent dehydrogenase (short-subunit alcohol dehydrogenase family) [Clostridium saccharoperbutylacetonicum]|uniref:Short-chain dehydrogenase/reductase SDR n=1 Tax=Clostridium saccharoperbutylacetonicum N1-4(HMT) TaxID=931276 RepID=M1LZQ2_9CLOT|nr:oxidoreductase [Clostridium saccharoperbutylacetonicum]AGF58745.1 short-chain dehydrogenase/reductase SDR [Clostridium saccharoperbutylacetonicum N1-4(HMT)]NRT60476.1 NAD(P)-dependent dehydrogenase (short-subunit alcohol dehydrogenase family) [Clostridium saccharoperbutylacetonicum]NSB23789.1 NAD(P)-dependent dehydrogenase (short-subunit alcohol dehydrogenase family) [Clostridium saccharoperbutylacetonicum]NSB43166.1 NAD(P)-dependent dehydrogenase (short-subunit alcohol dehydrogenase family)
MAENIKRNWTSADITSQKDRSVVITGTGGIGYETALEMTRTGAEVIMAGRNKDKGEEAIRKIKKINPSGNIRFEELDLADLASIEAFGERMRSQCKSLDILINNAAVMAPPKRLVTKDGFELQMGTNYFGHFALTAQMLSLLKKGNKPRVITLSSLAHLTGVIDFDDLQAEHNYKPMVTYSQSKLACLMFAFELQRRSDAAGWGITSMSAHPGISRTELIPNGAGKNSVNGIIRRLMGPFLFQPAAHGAWPSLYAATAENATGGTYYGPSKMKEMRGYPTIATIAPQAMDIKVASKLWEESEKLTNVKFI